MKNGFKILLLTTVVSAFAPTASAQSSSLEARVSSLEALVLRLEAALEAEKLQTDNDLVLLERKAQVVAAPIAAETKGSGFKVGDTTFKLGGFVDLDAHVTNFSDTPPGSASAGRDFQTDFLVTGQGNERITNSFAPRLRRAYIDYDGWRIGQEWSTFQNTSAIPESASFFVLTEGQVFIRQPIIRYTKGNFQIAAENGNATVIAAGSGSPLGVEEDANLVPDIVARYNLKGSYGNISLSAIGRQLRSNAPGQDAEADFGWGLSAAGRLNVGQGDIRFSVTGGEGLGRYIGLNTVAGAAINPLTGEVDAIGSIGGHIAYRHPITENTRFSLGVSQLSIDPKVTFGVEGLYGERRTEDGTDGDLSRFTFSAKYGF